MSRGASASVVQARVERLFYALAACALALWGLWFVHSLVLELQRHVFLRGYEGDQWFVSYEHGFVRRGLPGEVLALFGAVDSHRVQIAGWTITFAALIAVTWLIGLVVLRHTRPQDRVVVVALCLVSPMGLGAISRTPDRYDDIGIALLLATVLVARSRRLSVGAKGAALVAVTAAAAASEEFLLLLLVPLVWRIVGSGSSQTASLRGQIRRTATVCTPAFVIVAMSVAIRPSAAWLNTIQAKVRLPMDHLTAATVLHLSALEQLRFSYDYSGGARYTALTIAVWLLVFVTSVGAIAVWLRLSRRAIVESAVVAGGAAFALNVVFLDACRWWALAFAAFLAQLALTPHSDVSVRSSRVRLAAGAVGLVVAVVALQLPLTTMHPGDFGGGYWASLWEAWIPGPNGTYARWLHAFG